MDHLWQDLGSSGGFMGRIWRPGDRISAALLYIWIIWEPCIMHNYGMKPKEVETQLNCFAYFMGCIEFVRTTLAKLVRILNWIQALVLCRSTLFISVSFCFGLMNSNHGVNVIFFTNILQGYFTGTGAIYYPSSSDVIKWKHFPRNWPFVRGIHRSRWIPHTKASDAELWCLLWSASE